MPTVRFWPPGGGGTAVLFRTAFGGKVGMEEACCCPEENCTLCANNQALETYAVDLTGVTALCCTLAAQWNATYSVSGILEAAGPNVGCPVPGGGVQCNGNCDGIEFTASASCKWESEPVSRNCVPPGVGDPGSVAMSVQVWLVLNPNDSKYYWYARFGYQYQHATNCGANSIHFLSAGSDTKPDCLDLNVTLNYLCHEWSGAGVRAADFTGATVVVRNP